MVLFPERVQFIQEGTSQKDMKIRNPKLPVEAEKFNISNWLARNCEFILPLTNIRSLRKDSTVHQLEANI